MPREEENEKAFPGADRFAAVLATAQADLTKSHPERKDQQVKILWAGERDGKVSVIAATQGFLWRYVEVGSEAHMARYEVAGTVTAPIKSTEQMMEEAKRIIPKGMASKAFVQRKPTEADRLAVERRARAKAEAEAALLGSKPRPQPQPQQPVEMEIVSGAPGKPNIIIRTSTSTQQQPKQPQPQQPRPRPRPKVPPRPLTPKEQADKVLRDLLNGGSPTVIEITTNPKKGGKR